MYIVHISHQEDKLQFGLLKVREDKRYPVSKQRVNLYFKMYFHAVLEGSLNHNFFFLTELIIGYSLNNP